MRPLLHGRMIDPRISTSCALIRAVSTHSENANILNFHFLPGPESIAAVIGNLALFEFYEWNTRGWVHVSCLRSGSIQKPR